MPQDQLDTIARRLLRAFVAEGASVGHELRNLPPTGVAALEGVELLAAMNYALDQGWATKSPADQYPRLTLAGLAVGDSH